MPESQNIPDKITDAASQSTNKPKIQIRDYPIEIAGWENQHTRQSDGLEFSKWNFVVQREYKKGDERIVEKINIPAENVLQVSTLLQQAYLDALDSKKN
ncbi:MAG: hypothetical protein ACI87E_002319 [Mariniblastus sp.]|jgi:hypothetical protein